MKAADVPEFALTAKATQIPTKVIPDWDALHAVLLAQGYVIIDSDEIRTTSMGGEECPTVKSFNNHVRITKKQKLYTKRIATTRWFCTL